MSATNAVASRGEVFICCSCHTSSSDHKGLRATWMAAIPSESRSKETSIKLIDFNSSVNCSAVCNSPKDIVCLGMKLRRIFDFNTMVKVHLPILPPSHHPFRGSLIPQLVTKLPQARICALPFQIFEGLFQRHVRSQSGQLAKQ